MTEHYVKMRNKFCTLTLLLPLIAALGCNPTPGDRFMQFVEHLEQGLPERISDKSVSIGKISCNIQDADAVLSFPSAKLRLEIQEPGDLPQVDHVKTIIVAIYELRDAEWQCRKIVPVSTGHPKDGLSESERQLFDLNERLRNSLKVDLSDAETAESASLVQQEIGELLKNVNYSANTLDRSESKQR